MENQSNRKAFIISSVIVLLVIALGWYYLNSRQKGRDAESPLPSNATSTSSGGLAVTTTGGSYTVNEAPAENAASIPAPNFRAPLVVLPSLNLTQEVVTKLEQQLAGIQAIISKDPTNFDAWLRLGGTRKTAGDYAGAAADWQYLSAVYPKNNISFDNLGSLYLDFIKDYGKAELNYKRAVTNNPLDVNGYRALFSLYTDYGYKTGTSAASDILKEGIAANPKAIDLYVLLARYYAGKGQTSEARSEYDAAISQATAQGNTALAEEIQTEKSALQ